jgi:hypothetical protein
LLCWPSSAQSAITLLKIRVDDQEFDLEAWRRRQERWEKISAYGAVAFHCVGAVALIFLIFTQCNAPPDPPPTPKERTEALATGSWWRVGDGAELWLASDGAATLTLGEEREEGTWQAGDAAVSVTFRSSGQMSLLPVEGAEVNFLVPSSGLLKDAFCYSLSNYEEPPEDPY